MRNALLRILSLMLFAVVVSQSATAFAQRQTCALELKMIEPEKSETDELKPIIGARAIATKVGSRRTIPADMVEGQPIFPRLNDGDYKITISKRGYKRTVQPISFMCLTPSQDTLIYVKFSRGSSSQTVANEKLIVKAGVVYGTSDAKVVIADPPRAIVLPPPTSKRIALGGVLQGGVLNGKAIHLPLISYPAIARVAKASGTVKVQVLVDEEGNVIRANAISGHPLLRDAAVRGARAAKFSPTILGGQPFRVSGVINFDFKLPPPSETKDVTE